MDEAGKIVASSRSGPSNPLRVGVDQALRELEKAADDCLRTAHADRAAVVALGAGLAGTGQPGMKERMRSALQQAFPGVAVHIFTDLETALAAAGEGPVIILVAGTGSAAIGRNAQGQIWRAGGHGPLYSDEGSAYDIGRRAIAHAMKVREQQGSDSKLGRQILEGLGHATWAELQQRSNEAPDEVFPRVFPIVAASADAGDPDAREVLLHAARELSFLVAAIADYMGGRDQNLRIAKTGGALGRSVFFDMQVDAALKQVLPHARIGGLSMSSAEAAARAARS
jgi:N-acetylglucosamine kinase-like BadF-type ATPase